MKVLLIDNYDSFTYNLVHYIQDILGYRPDVFRNDEITVDEILHYDMLILSPGPGIPEEAGILKEAIKACAGKIPIFGVCLGLQAIVEVFGGQLENMDKVYHGVATTMTVIDRRAIIFKNVEPSFEAARYHSWIAGKSDFPDELVVTCQDQEENVMAIRHRTLPIEAVQFHPESILTPNGKQLLANFIQHSFQN